MLSHELKSALASPHVALDDTSAMVLLIANKLVRVIFVIRLNDSRPHFLCTHVQVLHTRTGLFKIRVHVAKTDPARLPAMNGCNGQRVELKAQLLHMQADITSLELLSAQFEMAEAEVCQNACIRDCTC